MLRVLRLSVVVLWIASIACAARAPEKPHTWQLRGVVASVQNKVIEVRHKTGRVVRITVDERTAFIENDATASPQSVRVGKRVGVEIESGGDGARARRVVLFGSDR